MNKMNSLPAPTAIEHPKEGRSQIREMLHVRTRELALHAGRIPPHVSQLDYEQAKRELTGESELDRQDVMIASTEAAATRDGRRKSH